MERLHARKLRLSHVQAGLPQVHLSGGSRDRCRRGPHAGFRCSGTLLRLLRGDVGAPQGRTGPCGLCAGALLGQLHLELCSVQVGGGHRHRRFPLLDTHLEVARIEVRKQLAGRDGLVVHDVHGDNRTMRLRTDGHDIADHIGIVRRLMRPIVLPEVPAIRERQPEQHDHESIEDIPGAPGLASRVA